MSQRRAWSPQEDKVLKHLREEREIQKWTQVAELMADEYGLSGRSGKQCRERYHNHLDTTISREEWQQAEQDLLTSLHNQMGNRWADISRTMAGRSQNCVKNQLYSILRRGLRCINMTIRNQLKRYKQLPVDTIYKLVEASELTHRCPTPISYAQEGLALKKALVVLARTPSQTDLTQIKLLIERIKIFRKTSHTFPTIPEESRSLPSSEPPEDAHSCSIFSHPHSHQEQLLEPMCLEKKEEENLLPSTEEVVAPSITSQELADSRLFELCSLDSSYHPQECSLLNSILSPKPLPLLSSQFFEQLQSWKWND